MRIGFDLILLILTHKGALTPGGINMSETIKYLSAKQIAESDHYPFTLGQIRHYLLMRHRNGLEKAVRKIGKRLYLRKDLFEEWIESNQGGGQ